jgi:hypothetical protein
MPWFPTSGDPGVEGAPVTLWRLVPLASRRRALLSRLAKQPRAGIPRALSLGMSRMSIVSLWTASPASVPASPLRRANRWRTRCGSEAPEREQREEEEEEDRSDETDE